jgi:hypothetical protein
MAAAPRDFKLDKLVEITEASGDGQVVGHQDANMCPIPRQDLVPDPGTDVFDVVDLRRLSQTVEHAEHDPELLLPAGIRNGPPTRLVAGNCDFAHCAVLLFPSELDAAITCLTAGGLAPHPPVPSVVVKRRLMARYQLAGANCDVWVTRLHPGAGERPGPTVEVFLFPRTSTALDELIVAQERRFGFENHVAFQVRCPTVPLLHTLFEELCGGGGLLWEGGGHNPHEGGSGSTVLYFVRDPAPGAVRSGFERWELHCPGDFREFLADRPVDSQAVARAYRRWAQTRVEHLPSAQDPSDRPATDP